MDDVKRGEQEKKYRDGFDENEWEECQGEIRKKEKHLRVKGKREGDGKRRGEGMEKRVAYNRPKDKNFTLENKGFMLHWCTLSPTYPLIPMWTGMLRGFLWEEEG